MAWTVEVDSESGFIHSVYTGIVRRDDVIAGTAETIRVSFSAGKGPHKFLTEWNHVASRLSTSEIFFIPNEWEAAGVSKKSVMALVVPKRGTAWKDALFYENACANRGWMVRVFDNVNDAVEWLEKQKIA